MRMIPSLPAIAHEWWAFSPRKYRLSATLAGSTCHVSLGGGDVRPALAPPPPRPPAVAGGGMQRRVKVPDQSVPAATFAEETRPSTVDEAVCADAMTMPAATA